MGRRSDLTPQPCETRYTSGWRWCEVTIDVNVLRERLRGAADNAALASGNYRATGHNSDADFQAGRQAAFLTALGLIAEVEDEAAQERDANIRDEQLGEEAARLGLICDRTYCTVHEAGACYEGCPDAYGGAAVDLAAVERLEEFARNAGGAVDMASGTVYSDADGGL